MNFSRTLDVLHDSVFGLVWFGLYAYRIMVSFAHFWSEDIIFDISLDIHIAVYIKRPNPEKHFHLNLVQKICQISAEMCWEKNFR